MSQEFSEYELEQISKLPMDIALLANKYKIDIVNAGESWGEPPFPDGYIPESIEIYYGEKNEPSIFILNGKLCTYDISGFDEKTQNLAVLIDGKWGYIQVEGKVLIDRLNRTILPEVIVEPSSFIQSILNRGK